MQIPRHEPHLIALVDSPLAALMHQAVGVGVPSVGGFNSLLIYASAPSSATGSSTTKGAGIIAQASLARVR